MGTGSVPPPDEPDYLRDPDDLEDPAAFGAPDDLDVTAETPSIGGEPTQMIRAVRAGGPSGPPPPPPPYGPGPGSGEGDNRRRILWLIVAGVFVVGIAIGALIVALTHSDKSISSATTTTDSSSSTSSSSSSSTSTTSESTTTSTEATTTTTTAPPARITNFQATSGAPNCTVAASGASTSVPSNPQRVTLVWSTQNATSVDVSVDGQGVYQSNIGASGTVAIQYGCAGPHSYILTAHGATGNPATQTVTVTSTH